MPADVFTVRQRRVTASCLKTRSKTRSDASTSRAGPESRRSGGSGEDDDLANRIAANGFTRDRVDDAVGRYKALPHDQDKPNPDRFKVMGKLKHASQMDGLKQVVYKLKRISQSPMYTHLYVDLMRE